MSVSLEPHNQAFVIDGWRVEPLRLKLVDEAGQELPLAHRAMSVLVELALAEGAVVRKYDLMSAVWGRAEVSDGALTQAIFELREAFGDDPRHPRIIETIRGVGFRLIPEVNAGTPPAESVVMSSRSWPIWGAVTVLFLVAATSLGALVARLTLPAATPVMASLAVLPLTNMDPHHVDDRLVERLHQEMRDQTARIRDIRAIGLNSVLKYSGTDQDPRQIARELGVTTLLQGEVSAAGAQIRVDLRLVDPPAEKILWAGQYTREPEVTGVLAISADMTSVVADKLKSKWSNADRDRALALPSQNRAALQVWFRAEMLADKYDPKHIQEAQALLERAIELDPGFAIAHLQLASLFRWQTWFQNIPAAEHASKIEQLVRRALELDAQSPFAHVLMADFEESEEAAVARFRKAIELDPNAAGVRMLVANYELSRRGEVASAVRHLADATEIDPLNEELKCRLADALGLDGRFHEARTLLQDVIESQPQNPFAHQTLGLLLAGFGRADEGIKHSREAFAFDPFEPHTARHIGEGYNMLGDSIAAAPWYERSIALSGEGSGVTFLLHGLAAQARGEEAAALAAFAQVKEPAPWPLWVATYHLAMADLRSGRTETAWQRYATTFPELLGPDPPLSRNNLQPAVLLVWLAAATDRVDQVRTLSRRTLALFRTMPRMSYGGSHFHPVVMRLALGEPEAAIAELQALVDAGEYRDLLDPVLFQAIADEPEFKRLWSVMVSRREEQLANLARMEREKLLAPIPEPLLAQTKPVETP